MFSGREKMKDIDGINRTNRKPRIMGIFIYTAEVYMMTEKVYIAKINQGHRKCCISRMILFIYKRYNILRSRRKEQIC